MNNLLAQATSFFLRCNGPKKYYGSNESICTFQDLLDLLYRLVHFAVMALAPIVVIFACVYGSFLVMTYGYDANNLKRGKTIITSAIIGLVITWSAWAIVNTFFYVFNIKLPCGAVWYSITPVCRY
jgi:hypothetical protein